MFSPKILCAETLFIHQVVLQAPEQGHIASLVENSNFDNSVHNWTEGSSHFSASAWSPALQTPPLCSCILTSSP